jgi:hypothetical protein
MVATALAVLPAPSTATALTTFSPTTDGTDAFQPTIRLPLPRSIVATPVAPELLIHFTVATRRLSLATPVSES